MRHNHTYSQGRTADASPRSIDRRTRAWAGRSAAAGRRRRCTRGKYDWIKTPAESHKSTGFRSPFSELSVSFTHGHPRPDPTTTQQTGPCDPGDKAARCRRGRGRRRRGASLGSSYGTCYCVFACSYCSGRRRAAWTSCSGRGRTRRQNRPSPSCSCHGGGGSSGSGSERREAGVAAPYRRRGPRAPLRVHPQPPHSKPVVGRIIPLRYVRADRWRVGWIVNA